MSKNKLDTSVYVDFSALNEWRNQMENINSSAMDTLDSFMSTVEDLKDSWVGNSAESFLTSATGVIN